MITNSGSTHSQRLGLLVGLLGVVVGIGVGFLAGAKPLYLGLALGVVPFIVYFFTSFEQTVLGLLILRTSLDPFSAYQLPAAFGLCLDCLTLLYVTVQILTRQPVRTDKFFWFFIGWVLLQGLWVVLPALGWGLGPAYLLVNFREWLRVLSWPMAYLLVMQLQDRVHPQKVISALFLGLIVPITVGFMQLVLPLSLYPAILSCQSDGSNSSVASCLNSTLGHPSAFGSFTFLFVGLTLWKMNQSRQWLWGFLIAILVFFVVMSKSLSSLIMVSVFIMALIAPKLNFAKLIGGVVFLAIVLSLFASTDFGQQKISGLLATPLFNSDIDITRTILLSFSDGNSANWRLAHWYFLLQSWQQSPILGYGLATSAYLSLFAGYYAHNDYVRFLAEEGLVGFSLFLTFIIVQISRLVRLMRTASSSMQRNLCSTMIAIFSGILVGMASDNIWNHTTLFLYWSVLSAVVGWNWEPMTYSDPHRVISFSLEPPRNKFPG